MEKELYHKIREEMNNCKRIHNKIVDYVTEIRENQIQELCFPNDTKTDMQISMYKRAAKIQSNLLESYDYDQIVGYWLSPDSCSRPTTEREAREN
jgi:hypothetical protein